MEIKLKELTSEQIAAHESEYIARANELCESYAGKFSEIGYELTAETKTQSDADYTPRKYDSENRNYPVSYSSVITITVRRPKTEEELLEDKKLTEETESEAEELIGDEPETDEAAEDEEAEEEEDGNSEEETKDESEEEADRTKLDVAVTSILLVRIYKSFWIEKVSMCDSLDTLSADLDEFYEKLKEKNGTDAE